MIPILFRIGPLTLYSFGLMAALAFLAGRWVLLRGLDRRGIPAQEGEIYTWAALIGGLVGGHVYYLIEHWDEVLQDPFRTIVSGAGLVWYGGLAGGVLAGLLVLKIKKHPLGPVADAFGPALILAYAFGRIGCFLAGDGCYGRPSNVPWAMAFPKGVVPTTELVHPTPIYESLMAIGIFIILKRMEKRELPSGLVFCAYLGLASLERLIAGFTRQNPHVAFGLSTVQLISIAGMILSLVLAYLVRRRAEIR
ncbi:MAG: prolipoprotein diacylglyceryl transferase [Candidatus Eisenbacteria bacterium]|nr:prolipoprotein diacylglyceryl transferase [Candidatus Eisenbacteria bacterium]MBU1950028.1 prolipoprotein diacylglyceryl transferase [Candidatus Eisenbacteria bacterium]